MKKYFFLLAAVASVSLAYAQKVSDKDVPAVVKSVLLKNYPNARDLKWEKKKATMRLDLI
ncbi:hypothetical protein KRR40_27345 [Niabella defluvii]|nr:hypothetical protein KRR40_27345 [Niabella sp. I65]